MGPAGAGRSPGSVLSIHGGSWEAATSPGGKGTGPGPRYSQEVAAHGGGDEHRDDHPAETPALAREGPAPKPPTPRHPRYPPEPPLTRGSAPWARTRGRRCPQGPRRRRRGRAAARSCAPSWPLRTDSAPPTAAPRRQSAPGARRAVTSHWRRRSARPGSARIGSDRHPHPSAPRSAKEHPSQTHPLHKTPLCYKVRTHTRRHRLPRQPGWAHISLRTRGSGARPPLRPAVRLPGRALPPVRYLGTLRSSFMSHSAVLSSAREPDWCVAARGVGT